AWFANGYQPDSLRYWPVSPSVHETTHSTRLDDDFSTLTWSKLKTNVGIGIATHDGDFRVDFAKRTDISTSDIVVTFRIRQSF
ncbi:hypothetical protein JXO59_13500, partial [candidate division KSB1 bacterium]|nr:hypothetical protein [candidate division KSB1 bacterium]